MATLFAVPSGFTIAKTLSCSTSRLALASARCGSYPSSYVMNWTLRPLTPPLSLSFLKKPFSDLGIALYAEAGPLNG